LANCSAWPAYILFVPGNPELEAAMRTWASTAKERLSAVTEAVAHLRKLFDMESETPPEMVAGVATEVITACGNLVEWLRSSHAPRGLGKAGGELGAAAGVYRNAAVAFRSLADADVDQRQVRSKPCASLLEQGDHHVETFAGILAKKLGDVTP
jgi:hypothetical protein